MFDAFENGKNLLIVEIDEAKRKLLSSYFSARYKCDEANSVNTALEKIHKKEYCVILTAISLSGLSGLELIPYLQTLSPRSIPIFISDTETQGNTVRAFRAGAFEVIQKPFSLKRVEDAIEKAFGKYELLYLKDRYQHHLEELVSERTAELDKALEAVEVSYHSTLKALVQALETRDSETHGHSERVVTFSLRLGHELGLDRDALRNLELGALLHDIGKIGVPDAILRKPAALTQEEWDKMKLHPQHGQNILRNIPFLENASQLVAQHHEKWDGTGYPFGIRGEDIDLNARIFAVADAFDAMVSDRVYRRGRSYEEAVIELERCAGSQFDPLVVEAFKVIPKDDWEILRQRSITDKHEVYSFQTVVAELVFSRHQCEMVH